ncbi:hypothetical protein OF83DRAFT_1169198 [Amylostereum chailletii]|nr:hypothetical protein OF83DRAFT_1169198 [Amylostereum chailletii]
MAEWFNSTTLIVDDRNDGIQYTGPWKRMGQRGEWDSTTTAFVAPPDGSIPSFTFSFVGTAIGVFGTAGAYRTPTVQFMIDGLSFQVFRQINTSSTVFNMSFYNSTLLAPGLHTLTAYVINQTYFYFDYLLYTPSNYSNTLLPSSSSFSSTPSLSFPSPVTTVTAQQTVRRGGYPVDTIVGGTVGALACLTILFILLFFWRRKRRNHPEPRSPSPFLQRHMNGTISRRKSPLLYGYNGELFDRSLVMQMVEGSPSKLPYLPPVTHFTNHHGKLKCKC